MPFSRNSAEVESSNANRTERLGLQGKRNMNRVGRIKVEYPNKLDYIGRAYIGRAESACINVTTLDYIRRIRKRSAIP